MIDYRPKWLTPVTVGPPRAATNGRREVMEDKGPTGDASLPIIAQAIQSSTPDHALEAGITVGIH